MMRTLRTIRYLRPEQMVYRVRGEMRKRVFGPGSGTARPGCIETVSWRPLRMNAPFLKRRWFARGDIEKKRFNFLNECREFPDGIEWSVPDAGRLWRYNLHYFDYLATSEELPVNAGTMMMHDWIEKNPPGSPDAWDPYPVSLRSVNWMKYLSEITVEPEEVGTITGSLFTQMLWLEKNLEFHLLANHLFKNAKALVFAGLFFSGSDAGRWLEKGIALLKRELPEQVLSDGGHFERSPMYHAMIFEDCLDLLNICDQHEAEQFKDITIVLKETAARMARFLCGIIHPDGRIALFNDSAFGIEAEPWDLLDYYEKVTDAVPEMPSGHGWSFPETGYYVISPKTDDRLIIDCGSIGPDYQPGHSHCDTLSFELSLGGRRIIVDSGCSGYEEGPVRQYNRGNAGHNTLTVDGENQSEVWASHRCARRAYPLFAKFEERENGEITFEGAHDGYRRLPGKPVHKRRFKWVGREMLIEDIVEGSGRHSIELRLHVNPAFCVGMAEETVTITDDGTTVARISLRDGGRMEKYEGRYCPEFGLEVPCTVLSARYAETDLPFRCGWRIKASG